MYVFFFTTNGGVMQTEADSRILVAHEDRVPFDVRQAVLQRLLTTEGANVRRVGNRTRKIEQLVQESRRGLETGLGRDRYRSFREQIEEKKRSQAEGLHSPQGPALSPRKGDDLHSRLRKELLASTRTLLGDVRITRVNDVLKTAHSRFARMSPRPQRRDGEVVQLVPENEVPRDVRTGGTNPWTVMGPPYAGSTWSYRGGMAGFDWGTTRYLDSAAGLVGNRTSLTNTSSGDWDYGYLTYDTAVGFWYRMPTTGLLDVWIKAQSASDHHHLSLVDEWGWSGSSNYQYNFLTLKATAPTSDEVRTSRMSWWRERGYTNGNWDRHYLTHGGTYWAHLFSDVSFPANSWVYVTAGTRTYNYAYSNDVSVWSTIKFKWFLENVYVRSTGG